MSCPVKRAEQRLYDAQVAGPLKQVWAIMDCVCGKRLAAILPELIAVLEKHGELRLNATIREKLTSISAATIDHLLAPERKRLPCAAVRAPSPARC